MDTIVSVLSDIWSFLRIEVYPEIKTKAKREAWRSIYDSPGHKVNGEVIHDGRRQPGLGRRGRVLEFFKGQQGRGGEIVPKPQRVPHLHNKKDDAVLQNAYRRG